MPPVKVPPEQTPTPDIEPVLEALVVGQKKMADDLSGGIDTLIHQGEKNNPEPILEASLITQKKTLDAVKEGFDKMNPEKTVSLDGESDVIELRGEQGPEGPEGKEGKMGPQGEKGKDGAQGPEGKVGPVGPVGPEGPEGKVGPRGLPGKQGPQGEPGKEGPEGKPGKAHDPITADVILGLIKGKLDYNDLQNIPTYFDRTGKKPGGGGPGYIREISDVSLTNLQNGQVLAYNSATNKWINSTVSGGGGSSTWGSITGTLSDQTDLQSALDAKLTKNSPITGATHTKITYDINGLVTSGSDATTADIADSSNKRYVTDAQLTVIGNTSGTNTGDETTATIKTKLSITTLSGSNTGDQNLFSSIAVSGQTTVTASTTTTALTFAGSGVTITTDNSTKTITFTASGGSGLTSLNSDTTNIQTLTVGTTGTDFAIVDNGSGDHKFNLPDAGASARGVVTTGTQTFAGAKTFSTAPKFSSMTQNSILFIGASGQVSENNSALTWDNTGHFLTTNGRIIAMGLPGPVISGALSVAIGVSAYSSTNAVALGDGALASFPDNIAIGHGAVAGDASTTDPSVSIGPGITNVDGEFHWGLSNTNKIVLDASMNTTFPGDVIAANIPTKASGSDVDTGTDDTKFVTAKALKDSNNVVDVAPGTAGNVPTSDGTKWTSAAPSGGSTPSGSIITYGGSSAPSGWLLCDGSAVSRSTYSALFTAISTAFGSGDGSTTFNVPDMRSRVALGVGTGTKVATFSSRSSSTITVTGLTNAANNEFQTGQPVLYSAPGGAMTGLTDNTTYYVIRVTATTFKLASTLANAQNGTNISLSSDGTGTQTFTQTLTARTLADTGGEENHAMSITELLNHTHVVTILDGTSQNGSGIGGSTNSQGTVGPFSIPSTGGNAAMNVLNPFVALNYIIKT